MRLDDAQRRRRTRAVKGESGSFEERAIFEFSPLGARRSDEHVHIEQLCKVRSPRIPRSSGRRGLGSGAHERRKLWASRESTLQPRYSNRSATIGSSCDAFAAG